MKPKVLIVGTFHFEGSEDYVQVDAPDILSEAKKDEVKEVVRRLAKFEPAKIAVEFKKDKSRVLQEQYGNYLKGTYQLTVNEIDQIGFRLAKQMNHKEIFAVDWMENVGHRSIGEVMEWAKEHQRDLFEYISETLIPQVVYDVTGPLPAVLKKINEDERTKLDHKLYMHLARVGEKTNYVGIDWVRWWYQRNLIIYHNLLSLIEQDSERILLLIGSGHIYLVRQFLKESGLVDIAGVEEYL